MNPLPMDFRTLVHDDFAGQVSYSLLVFQAKRAKHGKGENVRTRPSKSSSSSKQRASIENCSPPKRKGGSSNKRKISWKDDYSIQV